MADPTGYMPSTKAKRPLVLAGAVLAAIAMILSFEGWRTGLGGSHPFGRLATSVGAMALCLALVAGPERRGAYYALVTVTLLSCALTVAFVLVGKW